MTTGGYQIPGQGPGDDGFEEEGYDESQRAEILEVTGDGPTDGLIMTDLNPDIVDADDDDDDDDDDLDMEDDEVGETDDEDETDDQDDDEDDLQEDFEDGETDDDEDLDDASKVALEP